jgi:phosphatidylinositol glycan class S
MSINGWFHGPVEDRNTELPSITDEITYIAPHNDDIHLSEWLNNIYLIDHIKKNLQKAIEINSEACLGQFLMPEMFDVMLEDFKTNSDLEWTIKGPAHLRKYDILNVDKLRGGPVHDLYKLFTSKEMFRLLYEFTELDLFGRNAKAPTCSIELQRWTKGCYTVLGDPSTYADSTLDVFLFFNAIENVGVITYLLPEEDQQAIQYRNAAEDEDDDPVLLTIYPKNNALNVVFRSEGTTKFMKYVSKNTVVDEHGYSYILVCSYKE